MSITRRHLQKRLTELKVQEDQLRQQLVATLGAIADVEYWLAKLDVKVSPKEP